jgi:hypothetical protein
LVVAFAGSYVISLIRSPKLLDDERASKIKETENMAREKITPLDESFAVELGRWRDRNV